MELKQHTGKMNLGRIGVLMGGASSERKISLKSGMSVLEAIKKSGLEAQAVDIKSEGKKENVELIKSKKIDCAFLALHGRFGEDGQIQKILQVLSIPYTGSGVLASRLAMDKAASRRIFGKSGLHVPRYKVIKKNSSPDLNSGLGMPLVIKPAGHGSSIGLSIIQKEKNLKKALGIAFSFDEKVIIEEYIRGREMTVGILDERALPVIEIIPKKTFFDFEAKYTSGMTDYVVPARLDERVMKKIQEAALSAHKLLGCSGCSRVDIILPENNKPFILEVNTIPGFTSTSLLPKAARAAGIEFNDLCLKLIKLAYEKKKG